MTLASQLKQKSKSINLDRLKNAAKAKQEEREKAARLAEIELARKVRAKEKEKQKQVERKRLIGWLVPGLLSAWNQEDIIFYSPGSDEERASARKYLGYRGNSHDVSDLNEELRSLEIDIRVLQNRLATLRVYCQKWMPSVVFDVESLLNNFENQTLLFSKVWRSDFRREAIQFEKWALANYAAKLKSSAANEKMEIATKKASIHADEDILQVKQLADTLKPRIDTFRSQYWSLLNSPASIHLIQFDRSISERVNFVELVARRDYQFAVARYVLHEMKIYCHISSPDAIGKHMAAFGVAAGEELYDALDKHITDPELVDKFDEYRRLLNLNPNRRIETQSSLLDGQDVSEIVDSIFSTVEMLSGSLKNIGVQNLKGNHGRVSFNPVIWIDELSETSLYPEVDRLAYDIQWLRSSSGQKFKKEFTRYLNELAGDGKYTAKMKIFSEDDGMLIELPSGKEIPCDMDWDSFEQLMNLLEFEITETTSSGIVKLKWG